MKKLGIIALFISLTNTAFSQNLEVGLFGGTSFYNGDIDVTPRTVFKQLSPAGGAFVRYHFTLLKMGFAVRGQVNLGQLRADEKAYPSSSWRTERGFSFKSPITEFAVLGEWRCCLGWI